jgi:hypothetical protein
MECLDDQGNFRPIRTSTLPFRRFLQFAETIDEIFRQPVKIQSRYRGAQLRIVDRLMIVIVQLELLFLSAQSSVSWCIVLVTEERCDSLDLGI